jgi:lactoylglutathione lyase
LILLFLRGLPGSTRHSPQVVWLTILFMTRFLHTMYRVTNPAKSRAFYEALGFEFRRELPIVRNGELEATNYFFAPPGQDEELELTFNHDGRTYDLGTAYGHIAIGVNDLETTLARLASQGIEAEKPPYRVREGGSLLCFVRDPEGRFTTVN